MGKKGKVGQNKQKTCLKAGPRWERTPVPGPKVEQGGEEWRR